MNLQEAQAPIDREIVLALVQTTPETWDRAALELTRLVDGGIESVRIEISNPDGHREIVSSTDELQDAALRLADIFVSHGKPWTSVRYLVWQAEGGNWHFKADFNY